ncbi:MAG: hypothetical protein ABI318_14980 [Chthoniobacteraceae bacterium]
MKRYLITLFSLLFAAIACGAGGVLPDPILGQWRFFNNSTQLFRPDGTSTNEKGEKDAVWRCTESAPGAPRKYVVTYGSGKFVDTLTLKNGDTFLDGHNNFRFHVTANRIGGVAAAKQAAPAPPPPMPPANPPQKAAAAEDPPDSEYMGMKLHAEWFPKRETKTTELTKDLARISHFTVGKREMGNDIRPGGIVWGLTWLMPIEEAEKSLPGLERSQMGAGTLIAMPNWPQRSLLVRSYYGKFSDPHTGEPFTEVRLMSDIKRHLVSVELLANHPKLVRFEPAFQGRKEPYFDFVAMGNNASTSNIVYYQDVSYGESGVACIHTLLYHGRWPLGQSLDNVRWYLPAPLARKILEIAEPKAPELQPKK